MIPERPSLIYETVSYDERKLVVASDIYTSDCGFVCLYARDPILAGGLVVFRAHHVIKSVKVTLSWWDKLWCITIEEKMIHARAKFKEHAFNILKIYTRMDRSFLSIENGAKAL